MNKLKLCILFCLCAVTVLGQKVSKGTKIGSPFITIFDAQSYQASPQVWGMAQDSKGRFYFGNGLGLTRYDGASWQTFPVKNNTTVRSLIIAPDDKIYVGAKGEFGYFEEDSLGSLQYTSLAVQLPEKYQKFKDVWQIAYLNEKVYFAPFSFLIAWDGKELTTYDPPADDGFKGILTLPDELYIKHDHGVLAVSADTLLPIAGAKELSQLIFTTFYPYSKDSILVSTSKKGLFWYTPNAKDSSYISPFPTEIDSFLTSTFIYKGLRLTNGNYAFASLSKGVIIMTPEGKKVDLLNKKYGLADDAIYSIYEDHLQNLWLGTNNGLSYVELSSPIRHLKEGYKISGQILSIASYQNNIYLGTTSGLFIWDENIQDFESIPMFNANFCWDICVHHGQLFVGTNTGLYQLKGKGFQTVGKGEERVFELSSSRLHPEYLFASTLEGVHIYQQSNGEWQGKGLLGGLREVMRSGQLSSTEDEFWAASNFMGVYRFSLNWNDLTNSSYSHIDTTKGLPSLSNNYIYRLGNEIRIGSTQGILKPSSEGVTMDDSFPIPKRYKNAAIYPLMQDENQNIWLGLSQQKKEDTHNLNQIIKIDTKTNTSLYKHLLRRIPASVADALFYTNNRCWIGTSEGVFIYHEQTKPQGELGHTIVSHVSDKDGALPLIGEPSMTYDRNALTFNYAAPLFEMNDKVVYQYWLEGDEDDWSAWTSEVKAHYTNLYEGKYTFHVRAKNIYGQQAEEARYHFSIQPPIYRSVWAYIGYVILLVIVIKLIVKWNARRLIKEKQLLEAEVKERTKQVTSQNAALLQQREEIAAILEKLMDSNELIEKKNKDITDSITYASRIQQAILPYRERLVEGFDEHFIFFKPRDIVSGDYYWFQEVDGCQILAVADCTGHGVPGAFMSMVGSALLNQIVVMQGITSPEEILEHLHIGVQKALQQEQTVNDDGMDASICLIDRKNAQLVFAGAKNSMVYIKNKTMYEAKADRQSIGGKRAARKSFTKHVIPLDEPMMFYLFSDGYQDQFGGPDGRKLMKKNFKNLLFDNHHLDAKQQEVLLDTHLTDWMRASQVDQKQIDDILVVGVKIETP